MQLMTAAASPYVRKVRVLLRETGQLKDVEEVVIATSPMEPNPKALAANPTARIPALIRDDGPSLYDSRVICRYLDARANAGMYRDDDWDLLTLEATADAVMDSTVGLSYETRLRPEEKQFQPWIDAHWGKITSALTAIEDRWMSHLHGPMSIGHIGVACALGYIDLRHDHRNWRAGHDILAAWYAKFSERQSMIETDPNA